MIFNDLRHRVRKIGLLPGTPVYTGDNPSTTSQVTAVIYDASAVQEFKGTDLTCIPADVATKGITWLDITGLNNPALIQQLAERYALHPLTVEDILNVEQRPKVEEFDNYLFITIKILIWHAETSSFATEQLSLLVGNGFVLSLQDKELPLFADIRKRLHAEVGQRLREQGSDYLAYRLIDILVDQYFVVLEGLGDQIETLEDRIIAEPTPANARAIHRLKRQVLTLRKSIWPLREVINHLLQVDEPFISTFTRVYLRDLYDHTVQAIDAVETFRDILASTLDVYLSSTNNRLNEVMKVLTVIATIFIPITFLASVFGMNFKYMPELNWHWGYPGILGLMLLVALGMVWYFRHKKWF